MRRKLWRKLFHWNIFLFIAIWFIMCLFFTTLLSDRKSSIKMQNIVVVKELDDLFTNSFTSEDVNPMIAGVNDASCSFIGDLNNYPLCLDKIEWLKTMWKSHKCYAENGVDGSLCSFMQYLSEIENHCPLMHDRMPNFYKALPETSPREKSDLHVLLANMFDNHVNYIFIKRRITELWDDWMTAYHDNTVITPNFTRSVPKLNILIYMGFLTKESGIKFGEKSKAGGPLGELVQWSDLIAALFILGHDLYISTEWTTFLNHTTLFAKPTVPCPNAKMSSWHLIYTDIIGVRYIRRKMKSFFIHNRCKFRILDSFGTHAEFNSVSYFASHKKDLGGSRRNPWGGNELRLQQFLTMYPHTDDNTFLGFVVMKSADSIVSKKKNVTLLYGKELYMWKGMYSVIEEAARFTQLYATIATSEKLKYHERTVENYGVLSGGEFRHLLEEVKIFLGLGFPIEGPAPLEAAASGAIFINPRFDPPKSRMSYKFFQDKPTSRELTSQNPYMDRFIGKPYVITVDIENMTQTRQAISSALKSKVKPYVPFEFTITGFLQRLFRLLIQQNFCSKSDYPPLSALVVVKGENGDSCQETCSLKGLVCEPSFFRVINNGSFLKGCKSLMSTSSPYAPYNCHLQSKELLFSCASKPPASHKRLCPCRDFIKEQIALCKQCL